MGLFTGELPGGGPVEALIRVITQKNLVLDLEIHPVPLTIVQVTDLSFLWFLRVLAFALPDYVSFSTADFVASGYNIGSAVLANPSASQQSVPFKMLSAPSVWYGVKQRNGRSVQHELAWSDSRPVAIWSSQRRRVLISAPTPRSTISTKLAADRISALPCIRAI